MVKHMDENLSEAVEDGRVWAQIDLDALAHNYIVSRDYIWSQSPGTPVIAVIKANAYGHGAVPCARTLYACGCRFFAVACLQEALTVRKALDDISADAADILILGSTSPADVALLQQYRITQTVFSKEYASRLHAAAKSAGVTLNVHIKIDTGMHRIGFAAYTPELISQTVDEICTLSKGCDAFCIKGMFTHLSDADGGSFCHAQWHRFIAVKQGLEKQEKCPPLCHVSNSPGCMRYPQAYLNGVRIGALLFGVAPPVDPGSNSAQDGNLFPADQILPVMRLQTRIIHIHSAPAGEPIGYGALCRSDHDRTIATLSVGYADGWLRAYAGATVTVHTDHGDFPAPLVGRICMDLCMIDVTSLGCRVGDTVTLFGADLQSIEALADHASTIAYEIPCLVTARVPRIYHQ